MDAVSSVTKEMFRRYVLPAPVPGFVPDFVCGSQEQTV